MKKKGQQKKKKRLKLRIKVVLKLLLFIIIVATLAYYITNLKIRNINIIGTTNIKDVEIIEVAGIKNYPEIYKLDLKKMKKNIKNLPLVTDVKITRNPLGKLNINVTESKILFFYKYNNKYITSSNDSIEKNKKYSGFPTLINFTPDTVFDALVKGLNKIDYNIIKLIAQIEYTPYKSEDGTIIDNNLFTLTMNDGNTVKIDTVNMNNLNKYTTIYASLGMDTTKGIVYLDTIIDESVLFISYDTIEKDNQEAQKKEEKKEEKTE